MKLRKAILVQQSSGANHIADAAGFLVVEPLPVQCSPEGMFDNFPIFVKAVKDSFVFVCIGAIDVELNLGIDRRNRFNSLMNPCTSGASSRKLGDSGRAIVALQGSLESLPVRH